MAVTVVVMGIPNQSKFLLISGAVEVVSAVVVGEDEVEDEAVEEGAEVVS